jgi:hypothetical protein
MLGQPEYLLDTQPALIQPVDSDSIAHRVVLWPGGFDSVVAKEAAQHFRNRRQRRAAIQQPQHLQTTTLGQMAISGNLATTSLSNRSAREVPQA